MTNQLKDSKKILVIEEVEDEDSVRKILHEKFSLEGFNIIEANNGEDGLVIALREHPDLILLDILMPKMDGIEMMRKLRRGDEWGRTVPIIILSNLSPENEEISKAIAENEPAYYFVKSNLKMEDLVEKVKERLKP